MSIGEASFLSRALSRAGLCYASYPLLAAMEACRLALLVRRLAPLSPLSKQCTECGDRADKSRNIGGIQYVDWAPPISGKATRLIST
jgi:hypothetical protein